MLSRVFLWVGFGLGCVLFVPVFLFLFLVAEPVTCYRNAVGLSKDCFSGAVVFRMSFYFLYDVT